MSKDFLFAYIGVKSGTREYDSMICLELSWRSIGVHDLVADFIFSSGFHIIRNIFCTHMGFSQLLGKVMSTLS